MSVYFLPCDRHDCTDGSGGLAIADMSYSPERAIDTPLAIFGTPITPRHLAEQLVNESFCVSFFNRKKLGAQLDQLIRLCGEQSLFLIDNGAFSFFRKTGGTTATEEYWLAFEAWAYDIMRRCPQAVAIAPDVIEGTEAENAALLNDFLAGEIPAERTMVVWHLGDSIAYLEYLLECGFHYLAFGSSGRLYRTAGSPQWHARVREALAVVDRICTPGRGLPRPWLHMLRAQKHASLYPFHSSDSTNLAVNHSRYKHVVSHVRHLANRVKRHAIAGPERPTGQPTPATHAIDARLAELHGQWVSSATPEELQCFAIGGSPCAVATQDYRGYAVQVSPALAVGSSVNQPDLFDGAA